MIKRFFQKIGIRKNNSDLPVDLAMLQNRIEYSFLNEDFLIQALKHRSYLSISSEETYQSNERLEFLGDAVLDLIVTEHLYRHFPKHKEGDLSKKKSVLVSRQVLARIVDNLDLGEFLLMNKGEEKTGGRDRQSNLANVFESILGAIYLDGGFQKASEFVKKFLISNRDNFLTENKYFNYKSDSLEYSQAKGWGIPKYRVVHESGPDHSKRFVVLVSVNNMVNGKGLGNSKKKAEQIAAKNALCKLERI
jgi:ribonuclease-3